MSVQIRAVSNSSEREAVGRLRYDVYVNERGFAVDGADHQAGILTDSLDDRSVIMAAFDNGEVVATARVTPISELPAEDSARELYGTWQLPVRESEQAILGRLMVRPSHRGSPVCLQIFRESYVWARRMGVKIGLMDCTARQVPMNEAVGCRRYKDAVGDPEYGLNIPLVQILGDVDHLTRVRSPLQSVAEQFPKDSVLSDWYADSFPEYHRPCSFRLLSAIEQRALTFTPAGAQVFPVFETLSASEIARILKASAVIEVNPGNTILPRGNKGTEMYLVLSGEVDMAFGASGSSGHWITLSRGQSLGEGGFLWGNRTPRGWEAKTRSRCRLLSISAENFQKVRDVDSGLATRFLINLSRGLCRRLYEAPAVN